MVSRTNDPTTLDTAETNVPREPAEGTDRVVATFLKNLRKVNAPIGEVLVSSSGVYRIYTEIDSKSPSALDKVYRAEASTQREFAGSPFYPKIVLVFEHRNRAFGGEEMRVEFLERGDFVRVL